VAGVINKGSPAADEVRALFDRLQPTLPIVLANLVSLGEVAVTYQPDLEQLLVLLPQGAAVTSATGTANRHQKHIGAYLDFNLNLNLPPPCNTGYLPPQQQRVPADQDYPDGPAGDLYCRVPQDSVFNVRGARNIPCETVPGKRAPTVKMCESTDVYQPLNDGFNWKGDPNATLSGQPIPQLPPGVPPAQGAQPVNPAPPPIAAAEYDPATGTYVGPDGRVYTQANLAKDATEEQTWQTMLLPPKGN
jgi:phospholipid/cholesterol/gamma-HCH transport system substrate-binding protein